MARPTLSREAHIAEGLNDKIVWDEADELDWWLESCLMDGLDDDDDEDGREFLDRCDWCGQKVLLCGELVGTRDVDEGLHGPVYRVCRKCHGKQEAELQAELDWWEARGITA